MLKIKECILTVFLFFFSVSQANYIIFVSPEDANINKVKAEDVSPSIDDPVEEEIEKPNIDIDKPIKKTCIGKELTRQELEQLIKKGADVSNVCVGEITDFSSLFKDNKTFNQDISKWDVSNAENMKEMFKNADSFNQDISKWDVSKVKDMTEMFAYADKFNSDIKDWDVVSVEKMDDMFKESESFDKDLTDWSKKSWFMRLMHYLGII